MTRMPDTDERTRDRARELRREMTDAERLLWAHIRRRQVFGHRFRRQQPIGRYIVDFVCLEKRVIVELDGGQHMEQETYDAERTRWLEGRGYRVLRFWNNQVFDEIEGVLKVISDALEAFPPPRPSPSRGEGGH